MINPIKTLNTVQFDAHYSKKVLPQIEDTKLVKITKINRHIF